MKVTGIRANIVALPADEPLAGAAENPNGTRPIVRLEIGTDDGAVGVGVTYFGGALTGTLRHAVEELGALCHRRGPDAGRGGRRQIARGGGLGRAGRHLQPGACRRSTSRCGISRAKAMDLPLWKLLGGARDRVPTYASGALMRGLNARPGGQGRRAPSRTRAGAR